MRIPMNRSMVETCADYRNILQSTDLPGCRRCCGAPNLVIAPLSSRDVFPLGSSRPGQYRRESGRETAAVDGLHARDGEL